MIKAKKGKVTIKGTTRDILADFGCVVHCVFDTLPDTDLGAESKKAVMREVLEFSMMSEEEQQQELEKKAKSALSHLAEVLGAFTKDVDGEKSEEKSEEKEAAE